MASRPVMLRKVPSERLNVGISTSSGLTGNSAARFAPTRWTVILSARDDPSGSAVALEDLCQAYWSPIYAYIRRQGRSPHDAQDLTQEFFARLLAKNYLADVDRDKGRFRSFLLASLKHFLCNERDKAGAQKRGGGRKLISIDAAAAESQCSFEPRNDVSADKLFDRRWAMTLLDNTLLRLQQEYFADDKGNLFEHLKPALTGDRNTIPYAGIATKLGTTEGNIKVAVHRLRQRYRELLRAEIAETVARREDVEEELRSLFAALAD